MTTTFGLDASSRNRFWRTMWDWVNHGDKDRARAAALLLGKAFLAQEDRAAEQPKPLQIDGLDEGLKKMGVKSSESPESPDGTVQ